MTNEKAIQLLHRLQDEQFDGVHGDERREALEMAVRALSGEGDTISRQAAIEAFVKYVADGYAESPNDFEGYMGIVKKLPSAQPQRKMGRWIELGQNKDGTHNLCCGACGKFKFKSKGHANSHYTKERYKFCGGCGAKMEVEHG